MKKENLIWQVVSRIPRGKVATYGQVAQLANLPGYARFVGYAMRMLPSDSKLPWFRVVNSRGRLSLPDHSAQYRVQQKTLEAEGVVFKNGKLSLLTYQWATDSESCRRAAE
ncbi:MAG: cysteine methyltransferase [Gammaproteobacteria bacterium]|nr:cysteine methyltransferase [Gammaproteobacteria bacterium]